MRQKDDVALEEMFSGSKRIAMKFGVNAAIVHQTIAYSLKENQKAKRNLRNGRYWYYATYGELTDKLPFFTERQIRSAVATLEEHRLLTTTHFKGSPQPHTTWYDISDLVMARAYPPKKRKKQTDTDVNQSDISVTQSDTNVSQSDNSVTFTNLIDNHTSTLISSKQQKEIYKEKDSTSDNGKPFSHDEYKRWKQMLPDGIPFTEKSAIMLKELIGYFGEPCTIEYLTDATRLWGQDFHQMTSFLEKVEEYILRDREPIKRKYPETPFAKGEKSTLQHFK